MIRIRRRHLPIHITHIYIMSTAICNTKRYARFTYYMVLAIAAAILYVKMLTRFGMSPGVDGPYYAVQVLSIARTGHLKYPDPPLIFYVMYFFYRLLSDVFLGVAIGVTVFVVLSSLTIAYLVVRITGSFVAGITSMLVFLAAPFEIRLAGDFMKNAAGLVWIALLLILIAHSVSTRKTLKHRLLVMLASLVTLMLCGLTHILDYGFALTIALLIPLIQCLVGGRSARATSYEIALAGLITLAVLQHSHGFREVIRIGTEYTRNPQIYINIPCSLWQYVFSS